MNAKTVFAVSALLFGLFSSVAFAQEELDDLGSPDFGRVFQDATGQSDAQPSPSPEFQYGGSAERVGYVSDEGRGGFVGGTVLVGVILVIALLLAGYSVMFAPAKSE